MCCCFPAFTSLSVEGSFYQRVPFILTSFYPALTKNKVLHSWEASYKMSVKARRKAHKGTVTIVKYFDS